jgi:hypothetical protein
MFWISVDNRGLPVRGSRGIQENLAKVNQMTERPTLAYWFAKEPKLPHGDNRPVVIGKTLTIKGPLKLCENALHWSIDPFDALVYATGNLLYQVRPEGAFIIEGDKGGSRGRTALAVRDATDMLRRFAREQALSVAHLWDMPPIVREYLETGDETKRAAASSTASSTAGAGAYASAYAADAAADAAAAAYAAADAAANASANAAHAACAADAAAAYAADAAADAAAYVAYAADAAAYVAAYVAAARKRFNEMVTELFAA